MVKTTGFTAIRPDEPNVGIFEMKWSIPGPFEFDNKEDLEEFRAALTDAYSLIADPVHIESFEEAGERIRKEQAQTA